MYLQLGTMVQSAVYVLLVSYFLRRFYRRKHNDVIDGVTDDIAILPHVTNDASASKKRRSKNAVHPLSEDFGSSKSVDAGQRRKERVDVLSFLIALVLNTVFVVWVLCKMVN